MNILFIFVFLHSTRISVTKKVTSVKSLPQYYDNNDVNAQETKSNNLINRCFSEDKIVGTVREETEQDKSRGLDMILKSLPTPNISAPLPKSRS